MRRLLKILKKIILFALLIMLISMGYFGYKIRANVKQVVSYENEVEAAVKRNDIEKYKNLVLAIIYTESKGRSNDLMQSSESAYGQQHMISDPAESIDIGVAFLAESLKKAEVAGCDVWTAVQAYNFGLDYIDYVSQNGGKNSIRLADRYSKEVLSPLLGNTNEEKYPYYRPQSVFYNGGFLYNNGGNMFYADIVKMNETFVEIFN
ncbi:lysozyme family protein [Enterococcus sp. LJL99]